MTVRNGILYNLTGKQILVKTPCKLEPPDDEQWTVIAVGCLPAEGFHAIRYLALGGVHHPILDQGTSYQDYGMIAMRYDGAETPEFAASAGLLMDRWVTLNNAMPDANVVKAGKLLDYLLAHVKEMPSGPSVEALAHAIDVASDARFRYMSQSCMQISPLLKIGKEDADSPPVVKEAMSRTTLLVERRSHAIGGPGEILEQPLEVEIHIIVRKVVGRFGDVEIDPLGRVWPVAPDQTPELERKIGVAFNAWHKKYPGSPMEMLSFGFVSKEKYIEIGEQAKWVMVDDVEIYDRVRSTWQHQDDRNNNPSDENTVLVVMRCT